MRRGPTLKSTRTGDPPMARQLLIHLLTRALSGRRLSASDFALPSLRGGDAARASTSLVSAHRVAAGRRPGGEAA